MSRDRELLACASCGARVKPPPQGPPLCHRCGYLRCPHCQRGVHLDESTGSVCPECGTFITAPEGVGEEPPDESAASADGGWRFLGGAFGFFAGFLWMAFLIALAAGLVVGALVLVARGSGP